MLHSHINLVKCKIENTTSVSKFPRPPVKAERVFSYGDDLQPLWIAVICRAFMDALNHDCRSSTIDRGRAQHWLLSGGADFEAVCAWAGYDADYIRRKAKYLLAQSPKLKNKRYYQRRGPNNRNNTTKYKPLGITHAHPLP